MNQKVFFDVNLYSIERYFKGIYPPYTEKIRILRYPSFIILKNNREAISSLSSSLLFVVEAHRFFCSLFMVENYRFFKAPLCGGSSPSVSILYAKNGRKATFIFELLNHHTKFSWAVYLPA